MGRKAYTLIELLITIAIIGIMAGMILFALFSAQEQAKVQKTRALITRLDSIIQTRYESYRTRRAPINITAGTQPRDAARQKLDCLRDLLRLEMPDRWSDVIDLPIVPGMAIPSASRGYRAKWASVTGQTGTLVDDPSKDEHQGAECLYMIVMESLAQEGDSRDVFRVDQYGDADRDGFPEFWDAWQRPIRFLRWAPGFQPEKTVYEIDTVDDSVTNATNATTIVLANTQRFASGTVVSNGSTVAVLNTSGEIDWDRTAKVTGFQPELLTPPGVRPEIYTVHIECATPSTTGQQPFGGAPPQAGDKFVILPADSLDSFGVYPIYGAGMSPPSPDSSVPTFNLRPLVYSGGPNRCFGIRTEMSPTLRYGSIRANPFIRQGGKMIGSPEDFPTEENFVSSGWLDNIHNHSLSVR